MLRTDEDLSNSKPTYKESPLGKAIAKGLDEIKDYSEFKFPDTAEGLYAADMISELNKIISLLHDSIFPKFDKYKIPSVTGLSLKLSVRLLSLAKNHEKFLSKECRILNNLVKRIPKIIKAAKKNQKNKEITEATFNIIKINLKDELSNCTSVSLKNKNLNLDPNEKTIKILKEFVDKISYNQFSSFCRNYKDKPQKKSKKMLELFLKEELEEKLSDYLAENFLSPFMIYIFNEQSYKLATSLFYIYMELPNSIKEIAPFFNPEFVYGKSFRMASKHLDMSDISLTKKEGAPDDAYIYSIKSPEFTGEIDANQAYGFFRNVLFDELIPEYIGDYFNDYYEEPFVQSEIDKGNIFHAALQGIKDNLNNIIDVPQLTDEQLKEKLKAFNSEEAFNFISDSLSEVEEKLRNNEYQHKFVLGLAEKLANPKCTIGDFLGEVDAIKQRRNKKGFAADFLNDTLPPLILCVIGDKKKNILVRTYQIEKKELLLTTKNKLNILDKNKKTAIEFHRQLTEIKAELFSHKATPLDLSPKLDPNSVVKKEEIPELSSTVAIKKEISNLDSIKEIKEGNSSPLSKELNSENLDIKKYLLKLDAYFYVRKQLFERDPMLKSNLAIMQNKIMELKELLNSYSTSGFFGSIVDFVSICKNDIRLFGFNIIPLFNEILTAITSTASEKKLKHNLAQPLLNKIDSMHNYGIKLASSSNIKVRAKGQVTIDLANELEFEVQVFFNTNPKVEKEQFKKFSEHFAKVLHSQDPIMQEHRSHWKVITANIAIALTVVGAIALGGYAIHSKITHSHSPIFFNQTRRQKHIKEIDRFLNTKTRLNSL